MTYNAYLMQVFHDIFTTRLKIRKERDLVTNLLKIVKGQSQTYRPERRKIFNYFKKWQPALFHTESYQCTHLAIAIKCSTALVDPPSAITMTMALRNDFSVIMSRGFKSIFNNSKRYFPAKRHSSNFNESSAGVEELSRTCETNRNKFWKMKMKGKKKLKALNAEVPKLSKFRTLWLQNIKSYLLSI